MFWSQRTWSELPQDLAAAHAAAILPVGATEQHGPHLGCGVRRLFIVNAHVTNAAPLRCALEMLRSRHDELMVALFNTASLSPRVQQWSCADGHDWHANDMETSVMLAVAPEMVRPGSLAAADDPDRTAGLVFSHPVNRTSRNGVTGRPSAATPANGARWFEWMVEDLDALVRRGLAERPPLGASYFDRAADSGT